MGRPGPGAMMVDGIRLDPALAWTLRISLAALLCTSAIAKARAFSDFVAAVRGYRLLPAAATGAVARGLVAVEFGIGVAIAFPPSASVAALAAVAMLGLYTGAIAINLTRGRRRIDCGCGGPVGRGLDGALVARNGVLIAAAAACALPVAIRDGAWVDVVTVLGGSAALALLYAAEERLAALDAGRLARGGA